MKKKVSVFCGSAFNIGPASFAGAVENVILDENDINICLMNKAKVVEILEDGTKIKLDFRNYNTDNGTSSVKDSDLAITDKNNYYRPSATTVDSVDTKKAKTVTEEVKVSTTVVEETKTTEESVTEAATEETTATTEETTSEETTKNESSNNNSSNNNKYNKFKKSKA